jgi:DNA-binding transcriptional MerR regulator
MGFTIRELESLSGIKAHTIRIWEQRYNFLKPSRTQTNIRVYTNDELKTLLTVSLLNKYGYKISRIDEMRPEDRINTVLELPHSDAHDERLVNEMIACMIDLESQVFETILNQQIQKHGIEKTITGIIFQFLEKIGILWQSNRIVPIQEHIVSNIIRQKIISAIENLPFGKKEHPVFLLLLPEDEHHEMGLLFVYYLLRKQNMPVIYLGANVPLKDVQYIFKSKNPPYLYLHLTSFPHRQNFQKYIDTLSSYTASSSILVSGSAVHFFRKHLPANITFLPSFSEVTSYINALV